MRYQLIYAIRLIAGLAVVQRVISNSERLEAAE